MKQFELALAALLLTCAAGKGASIITVVNDSGSDTFVALAVSSPVNNGTSGSGVLTLGLPSPYTSLTTINGNAITAEPVFWTTSVVLNETWKLGPGGVYTFTFTSTTATAPLKVLDFPFSVTNYAIFAFSVNTGTVSTGSANTFGLAGNEQLVLANPSNGVISDGLGDTYDFSGFFNPLSTFDFNYNGAANMATGGGSTLLDVLLDGGVSFGSATFAEAVAVPEPTSMALLLIGLGALGLYQRMQYRKTAPKAAP